MNNWIYKGKSITSLQDIPNHENVIGFVYRITGPDGRIYIGKKVLHTSRKTRISKKEKLETATRKTFKRVTKESDWMDYYGSCKELKDDVKKLGRQHFTREILVLCCTKKYLSFCELEYQIKNDVLKTNSYNGNILSRYFERDMANCEF